MSATVDWYHGTHQRFADWRFPPPRSPVKPELRPHTAVFLTTDMPLAKGAGRNVCVSRLRPDAKVLDLRLPGEASEAMRQRLFATGLGRHCVRTHDAAVWWAGWNTGEAMRFAPDQSAFSARFVRLVPDAQRAMSGSRQPQHRAAWLELQNLTREWIELVAVAGRDMGFDALIGNEIDSQRKGGAVACEVLFALTDKAIEAPHWLGSGKGR